MPDSPGAPEVAPATVPAGAWVEIERVVLPAGSRAPNVPADTAETDFVARIRGFLLEPARIGSGATVRTQLDRHVTGRLTTVNPRNPANFGDPVPSLLELGLAARQILDGERSR